MILTLSSPGPPPCIGVRVVLQEGVAHAVDSNEMAFRSAAKGAFKQAMTAGRPLVLEPLMSTEVSVPNEFQGTAVALISQRKGTINSMEGNDFVSIDVKQLQRTPRSTPLSLILLCILYNNII